MFSRIRSTRLGSLLARSLAFLLVLTVLLVPPAFAQDDEDEKPEPQKEWVVGYALVTLPMAAAMFFMFRMNKRHDYKAKKEEGED